MADEAIDRLVAKEAITEVLHRYCRAVDRIDDELAQGIWHPDGTASYQEGVITLGSEQLASIFESHRLASAASHQLSNITIEVAGDSASSESSVHACIRFGDQDIVVWGRYLDTWSCREGSWGIDERRYVQDVLQIVPVDSDGLRAIRERAADASGALGREAD
jgi:hypothetical protein